jgi:hypothetical protein
MNSPIKVWSRRFRTPIVPLMTAFLILFPFTATYAQVSTRVVSVSPSETTADMPLTVKVELRQGESLDKVYFVYRPSGEGQYRRLEMDRVGNIAVASLPAKEVAPPFLEYYLVLVSSTGAQESYPLSENPNPLSSPPGATVQIRVRVGAPGESQLIFLSPDPAARLAPEDLVISVSLLRTGKDVVKKSTVLLLDDVDITGDAVFSDDIIVYAPENFAVPLQPGPHTATVRVYDRSGQVQQSAATIFTITGRGVEMIESTGIVSTMSVQLESRREQVNNVGTWYNRGGLAYTGRTDDWKLVTNLFLTSDEQSDRQPQNRYFLGGETSWLKAGYGDNYPSFPSLILSGKRVRGLHSSVKLGFFNVDVALGSTVRAIEGTLTKEFLIDSITTEYRSDSLKAAVPGGPPIPPYDRIDATHYGKFNYGTYARDLLAIRPSFGSGETFQLGFTWLKSKDDISSIKYGSRPQENLVVGTDLMARIDDGRIDVSGQVAFSAINGDISSGNFNDVTIDSTYKENAQTVKDIRNLLSKYITVNDYLRPLSFKRMATLAYDVSIGLNYFDNAFKFGSLYRGSDYNSFGQTFLRKDIRGFNFSDRIRLVNNQLYLLGGYERLEDNTSDAKPATTIYSTVNVAVSYYPRVQLPNLTVGFSRYANANQLSTAGPDSLNVIDDATNRFYVQTSYDFTWVSKHTAAISFSTSKRDDNSLRRYNMKNTTFSLSLSTRYKIPLQSSVDLSVNSNEFPAGLGIAQNFQYTSLSVRGRYSLLDETLSLIAAVNPTFGDLKRMVLEWGTEWSPVHAMSVLLQLNSFSTQGGTADNIWSLRYRYDL